MLPSFRRPYNITGYYPALLMQISGFESLWGHNGYKECKTFRGERITIGILSQFGMDIMLPMTDNLPFDIITNFINARSKQQWEKLPQELIDLD